MSGVFFPSSRSSCRMLLKIQRLLSFVSAAATAWMSADGCPVASTTVAMCVCVCVFVSACERGHAGETDGSAAVQQAASVEAAVLMELPQCARGVCMCARACMWVFGLFQVSAHQHQGVSAARRDLLQENVSARCRIHLTP